MREILFAIKCAWNAAKARYHHVRHQQEYVKHLRDLPF